MKRKKFLKYLNENNCRLLREGANHSWYKNLLNNQRSSVPRHTEIKDNLARKICKDLGIPKLKI